MLTLSSSNSRLLLCNGCIFNSVTYPNLYALVGSYILPNIEPLNNQKYTSFLYSRQILTAVLFKMVAAVIIVVLVIHFYSY